MNRIRWVSDAPSGWKSEDGRFRISFEEGAGWVLWDRGGVVSASEDSWVPGFALVTEAKRAAALRASKGVRLIL